MSEYLSFIFFWIALMVLIGVALWLTPRLAKRKDDAKEKNTQDIADEQKK